MNRHLLPDEIDLLLDGAEGFEMVGLRGHVESCSDCRGRFEEAQAVVAALDDLPHFVPSMRFADRVMAEVPVFVPWHVAAREAIARWVPESRPARYAALGVFGSAAAVLTVAMLWVATQTDLLVFATGLAGDRVRDVVIQGTGEVVLALFGQQAFELFIQAGQTGLVALAIAFVGGATLALAGLHRAAAVATRRRG